MRSLTLCLLATLPALPARAAEPLRLADLIAEARAHNPEIQVARARARGAAAMPVRAAAWDDPVVSWEAWNIPKSLAIGEAENNIVRLSQKIPFPGKRRLAGRAAEHDAGAAADAAEAVELDVVTAVTRAYWDLWESHQRLQVYEREQALLQRIAHVAEQKYALGEVSQSDVLRAQVERTHAINRVTTEGLALEGTRAGLNALLSRTPDEPLGTPEEPRLPALDDTPAALIERALGRRPELAAQTATIAREESGVRLARKALLPDFELSVGRFINQGEPDGFGAMASMTIPLAQKAKYDAGVSEARARLASAEAERRRLEDTIRREVQQTYLRVRSARLEHDLFVTTHLPQAEQALRVTEAAYQEGSVDFLALIDSVRAIEAAHLEHIAAAGGLQKALADLERAIGVPPERTADAPATSPEEPRHD